jgi:signal transduction histidine kinase
VLAAGLTATALIGAAGGALEFWRFGASEAASAAKVQAYVTRHFDRMTASLAQVAHDLATNPATAPALAAGPDGARDLFNLVSAARASAGDADDVSLTIYDATKAAVDDSGRVRDVARAWVGRPSDTFQTDRTRPFFVTQSPLGLRLVHVEAIPGPDGRRVGTVAAEHVLSPAAAPAMTSAPFTIATPIAPVSLRIEGAGEPLVAEGFLLRAPDGQPLAEASLDRGDLRRARAAWRRRVAAVALTALAITVFLLIGPLLDRRVRGVSAREVIAPTATASALLLTGTGLLWCAVATAFARRPDIGPSLAIGGSTAAALVALWSWPVGRIRTALRSRRVPWRVTPVAFAATQLAAGAIVMGLLVGFERLLNAVVDPSTVDLRHFALHPWNTTRMLLLGGVLAWHLAVLWVSTLVLFAASAGWTLPRRATGRAAPAALWLAPTLVASSAARVAGWSISPVSLLLAAAACSAAALVGQRLVTWYRHTTVAARIFALFLAFLVPSLLVYAPIDFFAQRATERLIAQKYAVEAQNHIPMLVERMNEALKEIDALTILPDLVSGPAPDELQPPPTESAFLVWNRTVLARARVYSAVELYNRSGALVSRFALNLPEYSGTAQKPQGTSRCSWDAEDVFAEAQLFGSEERHMLHAERGICAPGSGGRSEIAGTIVVHVALDYRTLPFIASPTPYFAAFRADGMAREGTPGGEVVVSIYGWGLTPIYTSGRTAWPITDDLFSRIYVPSRAPFWARIPLGGDTYRVHFSNDRLFIYAIGYPVLTPFDRLVHIAELTILAGIVFVLVLVGTAVFTRLSRSRPRVGRALLREIRASFYRKLFLAFVLASIVPVLTLAFVIRTYFADLLRADVAAEAARTAAVARRVIEGSDALRRRGADVGVVSDDVMVWLGQVIEQDVNIFDGPKLVATSERDLFASGLLPTRTPDDVYRAIALARLPSFVDEDQIGSATYMIAAAPVRAGGRDAILTVPFANRQREIEREIDDLDRGVQLAALFFILLGAAIGLSLAERIADPIRRLTRATRRIAAGDFDARIAVRTADELRRLVDAFNSMAAELKAQQTQLERTHRLEAWAEMARQVAHEIKNPLTPIQLSAEHLRRVHEDRGEPMGPVLESCVESILGQVRLLRQISAEFSSFASSPTARPAAVDVPALVAEVIDPYRTGLERRIEIENRVRGPLPAVYVDRTLVARALANIIENALHAMPRSGRLTIDGARADSMVVLTIADTGVGMDRDALERVFEPYFSTKTTGTGLGLPIARRNIELSGGTVDVISEKGVGTTVRVKLPLAEGG